MTWASKLIKKIISPLDAWESVPNEDPSDLANTESLLKFDDLVLAVLEKNKQIHSEVDFDKHGTKVKSRQALAFRELVEAVKKVKKMIRELDEEKLKLYESMGKILNGDFKYDVSNYKDTDWCSHIQIESTRFNETFFIDKDTGKNRYDSDE